VPYAFEGISTWLQRLDRFAHVVERTKGAPMSTTVTTPTELEIRVERVFDAPRAHVYSVWTDPTLIPEWWGDGTVVEEMDVRPGGSCGSAPPTASSRASTARSSRHSASCRRSRTTCRRSSSRISANRRS
jgi:hypothetical protein